MAEDLTISHGEPQWDVKYNNLVNTVEAMGWSEPSQAGIVVANSTWRLGDSSYYSYVQLPGDQKLVYSCIILYATADFTGPYLGNIATVPDVIKPKDTLSGVAGDSYRWAYLNGSYVLNAFEDNMNAKIKSGDGFIIQSTYRC